MTKLEAPPSRSHAVSGVMPAKGRALINVSWDAGPDLEQFLGFINAYAKARFSASLAERLTLASTELLDNAVRYGSLARDFNYRLELAERRVSVCVQNTTVKARIDMLSTQLKRLQENPAQVYNSELERSMIPNGRRSMLGLARIRHEAEMEIELSLDDAEVTVRATCAR